MSLHVSAARQLRPEAGTPTETGGKGMSGEPGPW